MKMKGVILFVPFLMVSVLLFMPPGVLLTCDGMDGPVVKAAKRALETGNVNLVLICVQKQDEGLF
jgi:hypothetical protein